ncbi:phospholipid scramblase 2-like [Armigeres subalbatus]|uniref:phospholipid scramblase 2-like n=1 Tax=Armigeres subalbatus TaxID=124917 RepID=UPI002ED3659D
MDSLDNLKHIDHLLVRRHKESLETGEGPPLTNQYVIENIPNESVYRAAEGPAFWARTCFGHNRPFKLVLLDNEQRKAMVFKRPLFYKSWRFLCRLKRMDIIAPGGELVARIQQGWFFGKPWFIVMNSSGERVLRIEGPWLVFDVFADVKFKIVSIEGEEVGEIVKKKIGCTCSEVPHHLGISFFKEMDATMKAALIGALILIDFAVFNNNRRIDLTSLLLM